MRRSRRVRIAGGLAAFSAALLGLAVAHQARSATTDNPTLSANVGGNDAYVISLTQADGSRVTHLDPGTYTITVYDESTIHNFHLTGPGVDKATSIFATGETTWTVTFVDGYYKYKCDPHISQMHGAFTVGTGTPPPPPAGKILATVGPSATITVKNAAGVRLRSCASGKWVITVRDLSATENFRLVGPGLNRATGVAFRGTVRWSVQLRPGKYMYRSDHSKTLRGTFTARSG
jgi:plastocyanin